MNSRSYAGICISQDKLARARIDKPLFGVSHRLQDFWPLHQQKTNIIDADARRPPPPSTRLHLFVRRVSMERCHSALSHCRFSFVLGTPRSHSAPDRIRSATTGSV